MYLVVEVAKRLIVGGLTYAECMSEAKRIARERGKPAVIRDTDASANLYTVRPESLTRRKACDCPPACYGPGRGMPGESKHTIQCRPARPACRWRRREKGLCHCDRYHYPHRDGSGFCGDEQAYIQHMMTPRHRAA
jgi:hypothetical protein